MIEHKPFVFSFADVEVRESEFCIVKAGEVLPVEPRAFRVLVYLLRNPRRLITKDELLNAVWNDYAVSENSLTRCIALLRRLLGDDTRDPRYIATVPTVGYRFLCDVEVVEDGHGRLKLPDLPHPDNSEGCRWSGWTRACNRNNLRSEQRSTGSGRSRRQTHQTNWKRKSSSHPRNHPDNPGD